MKDKKVIGIIGVLVLALAAIIMIPIVGNIGSGKKAVETIPTLDKQGKNDSAQNTSTDSASKNKVTFIELGSVKCIPCKMMQPVMKKIEETYKNEVEVVFYDVWTEKDKVRADEYRINAIPTQVFLDREGVEYYRHAGFFPFEEVEKILKQKL
jgi:thioredoxin 1